MNFHFTQEKLSDFKRNIKREWAITNGLGSYGGGSILGALNRTHQGYLIASLHPPVERYLVFSKTNERITCGDTVYDLETSQHAGAVMTATVVDSKDVPDEYKKADTAFVASDFTERAAVYTQGQKYLSAFDYDGTVCFTYQAGDITIQKHISLKQGENTAAIAYEITNTGSEATLTVTPLMNYRQHQDSSTKEDLQFKINSFTDGFTLIPDKNPDIAIRLSCSNGTLVPREDEYDIDLQFATEVENEVPGLDTCYTPYDIEIVIPEKETMRVSILCEVISSENAEKELYVSSEDAFLILEENQRFFSALISRADCKDEFSEVLTIAANQFLSERSSTGLTTVLAGLPWFTDWGRDTMIAFTGLVLSTHRFKEAEEILLTFAKYIHHGMVPNMFPDDGQAPLYNTVDASLWYFYAVDKYLSYNNTDEAYDFIKCKIYPALKEIITAYKNGTDFSIYMDDDYLIHAGSGVDQVTWMDVRVGDWVVTPRHGKPVEINALWYNGLRVMEKLAARFQDDSTPYGNLAQKVQNSFTKEFWNEKDGCLYDVIDKDEKDASIRPNQIYAVSLPYTMLDEAQAKSVVDVVNEKLFVGVGLRSLDPAHPDYHPIYVGSLPKRDAAYHQGTAWGFLLGGFITAYTKVYGASKETAAKTLSMIAPVKEHLTENCIGSICEIFDGNAPHNGRGCYAQAWSVGETLRAYTEDILPNL